MRLKKNGYIHKIAYGHEKEPPEQTNLCSLFWRLLFNVFIGWPIIGIVFSFFFLVASGTIILVAKRLSFSSDSEAPMTAPISHWPAIKGHKILPIYFVPPTIIYIMATYYNWTDDPWKLSDWFIILGILLTTIILILVSAALTSELLRSELCKVITEWFKAKKNKYCLIVSFVDEKTGQA